MNNLLRPRHSYDKYVGSGQGVWCINEAVLIGVIMLFVLADSFCVVPSLLITSGEQ